MNRRRYIPDLKELHSLAERNYASLSQLLPATLVQGVSKHIQVGEQFDFELSIEQTAPYTTDVLVTQNRPDPVANELTAVQFSVRLYHDARMAEIIDCQGAGALTAIRPGQAPKRASQQDEKRQLSRLLADWLKLCVQQGRSALDWVPNGAHSF
ncbi:MAG: DUF1249 domain-containing protein [Idiomarina sp.]|nr:DUF1249 domain-containing protein [Idiomarina sp.]